MGEATAVVTGLAVVPGDVTVLLAGVAVGVAVAAGEAVVVGVTVGVAVGVAVAAGLAVAVGDATAGAGTAAEGLIDVGGGGGG